MCRCLEVRCVQVYLVSKCRVCSALVSVYGSQASVLVKCCNLKSQVLNKSSLVQSFVQKSSVRASANLTIWYQSLAVRDHVCGV